MSGNVILSAGHGIFENNNWINPANLEVLVGCDDLSKRKYSSPFTCIRHTANYTFITFIEPQLFAMEYIQRCKVMVDIASATIYQATRSLVTSVRHQM